MSIKKEENNIVETIVKTIKKTFKNKNFEIKKKSQFTNDQVFDYEKLNIKLLTIGDINYKIQIDIAHANEDCVCKISKIYIYVYTNDNGYYVKSERKYTSKILYDETNELAYKINHVIKTIFKEDKKFLL